MLYMTCAVTAKEFWHLSYTDFVNRCIFVTANNRDSRDRMQSFNTNNTYYNTNKLEIIYVQRNAVICSKAR